MQPSRVSPSANLPVGSPLSGEQALHLLALMGHLAQKAQRAATTGPEDGLPAYRSYTTEPQRASGTAPVPLVAGVQVPVLPAGVADRNYWFPDRSRSPIRPLRRWTIGPMRSAWSL